MSITQFSRIGKYKERKRGQVPALLDDHHLDLDHLHCHHHRLLPGLHPQRLRHQQLHRLNFSENLPLKIWSLSCPCLLKFS